VKTVRVAAPERAADGYRILLVDDSRVVRGMIEKALGLAAIPVAAIRHAANGREALEVLGQDRMDLVFVDINMPVMDGIEMLQELRESGGLDHAAVIVLTSEGGGIRVEEMKANGAHEYLRKPFTAEMIRSVVDRATRSEACPNQHELVATTFAEVVRQLACLFCEFSDSTRPEWVPSLRASVRFSGAVDGALFVWVPVSLCPLIAANVLGVDEDGHLAVQLGDDAVQELLNVACGHLLTKLAGEKALIDRTLPEIAMSERAEWERAWHDPDTLRLTIESSPVLVRLQVEL